MARRTAPALALELALALVLLAFTRPLGECAIDKVTHTKSDAPPLC
jgi:hypothetical protein